MKIHVLFMSLFLLSADAYSQIYENRPSDECEFAIQQAAGGETISLMSANISSEEDLYFISNVDDKTAQLVKEFQSYFELSRDISGPLTVEYSRFQDGGVSSGYAVEIKYAKKSLFKIFDLHKNLLQVAANQPGNSDLFKVCDGYELEATEDSLQYVTVISERVDRYFNGLEDLIDEDILEEVTSSKVPKKIRKNHANDYGDIEEFYIVKKGGEIVGYALISGDVDEWNSRVTLVFYTDTGEEVDSIKYDRG